MEMFNLEFYRLSHNLCFIIIEYKKGVNLAVA